MKLASIRSAKAIWLVPLIDINQRGRFLLPAAAALVERYGFAKPPDHASLVGSPTKISFEMGAFAATDGTPIYVNLTVHDDGLVAETRTSTEEADRFLSDALTWLSGEFQLPAYADLGVKRIYTSEVSVIFEGEFSVFNDKFKRFSDSLRLGALDRSLELINLNFGTDPSEGRAQAMLRIEREVGVAFAAQRYYSYANTTTSEHLRLLQAFEEAAR